MLREEATTPTAAIAPVRKNNEQKIRRHRAHLNIDVEFVMIELTVCLD
jgi:hypothetical protein